MRDYIWSDKQYFAPGYWPRSYSYWPLIGWVGVVAVTLYERLFGSCTLYERKFGTATLDDKP